jgi:choline dehydrogenase-like flavoprotein
MAVSLSSSPYKIVIVSGGDWAETVANQDLHRGIVKPEGSHEPLEENRRRQFGGASTAWGGRCIPFDPIDFEARSYVADSGWPISYEQILPYYHKASSLCEIGQFEFDATKVFSDKQKEIIEGFDSEEIVSFPLERWSPPINFATFYKSVYEKNPKIDVLLDAHVLSIEVPENSTKVKEVKVAAGKNLIKIRAAKFILAAGGIENARLLLASSNNIFPTGLGNQNDNVGRYYMAHIMGTFAEVNIFKRDKVVFDFEKDKNGVYCRRRWWIPENTQKSLSILNTIFFLHHPGDQNGHRDVLFSAVYVTKTILSIIKQKSLQKVLRKSRQLLPGLKDHLVNIAKNGVFQLPDIISLARKRMSKRRLPFILPSKKNKYWGLYFQAEQVPNRESRIYLSKTKKDALGMPRVEVEIKFQEIDIDSIVKAHNLFVKNFKDKQLGEIIYTESSFRNFLQKKFKSFNSAAHHIGTTRMSEDPKTGVVDKNSKVFGIDNLYITGSSIFPTGGHANPTLTIVAHSLYLADHINELLKEKQKSLIRNEYESN